MFIKKESRTKGKNIYSFIEWYKLNLGIRADLVPVLEDVRLGANVELWKFERTRGSQYLSIQKRYLEYCLVKLGLYYKEQRGDYYVSKSPILLNQLWSREIETGEFLGYPKCCIDAFKKSCQEFLKNGQEKGPAVLFYRKLKEAVKKGSLNEALFYTLHIHCELDCQKTIILTESIKLVLESRDIEAAYHLMEYNWNLLYAFNYKYPD
ncbi:MAG: hypothetical protein HYV51_02275 [Parcubacteria group bacterium]|nr:hypothetical protein [Parcubacteria group bacterium]